jgi:hypothetical protein
MTSSRYLLGSHLQDIFRGKSSSGRCHLPDIFRDAIFRTSFVGSHLPDDVIFRISSGMSSSGHLPGDDIFQRMTSSGHLPGDVIFQSMPCSGGSHLPEGAIFRRITSSGGHLPEDVMFRRIPLYGILWIRYEAHPSGFCETEYHPEDGRTLISARQCDAVHILFGASTYANACEY